MYFAIIILMIYGWVTLYVLPVHIHTVETMVKVRAMVRVKGQGLSNCDHVLVFLVLFPSLPAVPVTHQEIIILSQCVGRSKEKIRAITKL